MTRAPLQFGVLGALENPLPQDQASLGCLLALDRSTLAAVVRNLEGRGLVIWCPCPTYGRAKIVAITPEGAALLAASLGAALRSQERIAAPLNAEERALLVHLLAKVAQQDNALSRAPKREQRRR
jgi:DNA-binding MarR family transcriptional regulator